eukprot:14258891-Heterocapsa_arctica.AAC.1
MLYKRVSTSRLRSNSRPSPFEWTWCLDASQFWQQKRGLHSAGPRVRAAAIPCGRTAREQAVAQAVASKVSWRVSVPPPREA